MKIAGSGYYVPSYKQQVHMQLIQGSLTNDEYPMEFFSLVTRAEFPWNGDVMISMHDEAWMDPPSWFLCIKKEWELIK